MSDTQHPVGLVKLSGTITRYTCQRADASFFFTESDDMKIGVVAVAAALAGVSGPAIATASYASAEEPADYLEFELEGEPVKGWVWRSPFKDGDAVDVAAEWQDDHYEIAAVARPADGIIALYPHCSRGTVRHVKNALKWWFWGSIAFNIFFIAFLTLLFSFSTRPLKSAEIPTHLIVSGTLSAVFALMTFSLARRWMPFVRLTERICQVLDFPNPGNIDLVKSSKLLRKPEDDGAYGHLYFRYR
ncbi:putative type VI secretion system effector [Xenophilus aerolatus]|nr:putative type VI secretion system effector [Xenophilus aerolatus]